MLFVILGPTGGAAAWTLKVIHSFCPNGDCSDGSLPDDLIEDSSGRLFGTLGSGGYNDAGAVFELTPSANGTDWRYKVLHKFCAESGCPDGARPPRYNNLVLDAEGNLYGQALYGGPGESGVIFRLSPGGKYKILYGLCETRTPCNDGYGPYGLTYAGASQGLIYDGVSPLYGLTAGDTNGDGNVFVLERKMHDTWAYTVLHAFCSRTKCADGKYPTALIPDTAGNIYGAAAAGGKHGHGLIFKFSPLRKHQWAESIIYGFCSESGCVDGTWPVALSIASDGSLFGTTWGFGPNCEKLHNGHNCGVLFQIKPDGTQYNVLHGFCAEQGCVDGRTPITAAEAQPGIFFGPTYLGGATDYGTIFQFQTGIFQSIYQFCTLKDCEDGKWPESRLVVDPSGAIFGTTSYGGAYGYGEVFELLP